MQEITWKELFECGPQQIGVKDHWVSAIQLCVHFCHFAGEPKYQDQESRTKDSGYNYILQDKTLFCAFEAGDIVCC